MSEIDEARNALATVTLGPSRIVVGLDLGTTFTGFKFCQRRNPGEVFGEYNWPSQAAVLGRPYCKTSTSSLYERTPKGGAKLVHIGYPAIVEHLGYLGQYKGDGGQALLQRVKLQLAGGQYENGGGWVQLPWGLTVHRVLSDYVARMKEMALVQVRSKLGAFLRESDIQWCLTVPAIWDDAAKEEMKRIAETAGLVGPRGSQHPLLIVLEPEAAALYCDSYMKSAREGLKLGDIFMVADVGGGTLDLIVFEKLERNFREVVCGSGDLCGGALVDKAFHDYLSAHIGPAFDAFEKEDPCQALSLATWWDTQKRAFTGAGYVLPLNLPVRLAQMWAEQDKKQTRRRYFGKRSSKDIRDKIVLEMATVRSFFDPTVNRILQLMDAQLKRSPQCKYLFVVGGFAESPYLAKRILEKFAKRVTVVQPPEPGAAICHGAVTFGLDPSVISERTARKTYGISYARPARASDPEERKFFHKEEGLSYVQDAFYTFVRNGDSVPVDSEITHNFRPLYDDSASVGVKLLSTKDRDPQWATDAGVESWTCFSAKVAATVPRDRRNCDIKMKFGGTSIEVTAIGAGLTETPRVQAGLNFEGRFGT